MAREFKYAAAQFDLFKVIHLDEDMCLKLLQECRALTLKALEEDHKKCLADLVTYQDLLIELETKRTELFILNEDTEDIEYQIMDVQGQEMQTEEKCKAYAEADFNPPPTGIISYGNTVLLQREDKTFLVGTIVDERIADASIGALSGNSPIGAALLHVAYIGTPGRQTITAKSRGDSKTYRIWRII